MRKSNVKCALLVYNSKYVFTRLLCLLHVRDVTRRTTHSITRHEENPDGHEDASLFHIVVVNKDLCYPEYEAKEDQTRAQGIAVQDSSTVLVSNAPVSGSLQIARELLNDVVNVAFSKTDDRLVVENQFGK